MIPPPEIIDAISDLPTKAQRGVRYTKREQWHVTVKFLGETNTAEAFTALAQLDGQATDATIGPAVTLLGTRIVMLPVAGLEALAAATTEAFADVGEPQPERDFQGHLTIARLKGAPLRDPSTVSVIGTPIDLTFRASTIALIKTELAPEGATHTLLAEKQLT